MNDAKIEIVVADDGPELPAVERERALETFRRLICREEKRMAAPALCWQSRAIMQANEAVLFLRNARNKACV